MSERGKVYILGVGPGDYKLMTIKAVECIQKSDVIVYDRLVNNKVLKLAKKDAELIYVGKMPDCHALPQEGINELLVKKAMENKTVARVKGGDPFVFGRGGEEAQTLYENGVEFEIIPGVTSAVSVPAYAGIPVTHRDFCSSLHIITGHEKPGRTSSFIDYEVLAKLSGTLVFLMGIKNLQDICTNLIENGKDKTTSVAVIENGTTVSQRTVTGTLEDIADRVKHSGIQSPAVTVVGQVVGLKHQLHWFPKGKLAGKRVIVTRSREQASSLVQKIEDLGGEALEFPTIKIEEPSDYTYFDNVLDSIRNYQWIVFTSVNGVYSFFQRMRTIGIDMRNLWGIKLCAIGDATSRELRNWGLMTDVVPEKFTSEEVLKVLLEKIHPGEKVLLARADLANQELSQGLENKGIDFDDLTVYRTSMEQSPREDILELLTEKKVDYITFTSSSTVRNFISILGKENLHKLEGTKVLCIGPVTRQTAVDEGLLVYAMADVYTIQGLMDKMLECAGE